MRPVMAASMRGGSMFRLTGSISTKTGLAPVIMIEVAEAMNVNGVVMTSSPGADPQRQQAQEQAAGAAVDRHGVPAAQVRGERFLEPAQGRPQRQVRAAQHFHHALDFPLRDIRPGQGYLHLRPPDNLRRSRVHPCLPGTLYELRPAGGTFFVISPCLSDATGPGRPPRRTASADSASAAKRPPLSSRRTVRNQCTTTGIKVWQKARVY